MNTYTCPPEEYRKLLAEYFELEKLPEGRKDVCYRICAFNKL